LFLDAGCANCHGGINWTLSVKDFTSPPAGTEIFTERNPAQVFGNPVGAQYLNRFLRDIGSFQLGVPGGTNLFGNNVGADEFAAPTVVAGAFVAGQDALGIDYNNDGKGTGFNVPSLLGLHSLPPYLHNGAAESLAAVVSNLNHRTDNGRQPDGLSDPADQAKVVKFLESIDLKAVPFLNIVATLNGSYVILAFDSVSGVEYDIEERTALDGPPSVVQSVIGNGARLQVALPLEAGVRFFRLVAP
jgi:cytochrome c peroxidase